MANITRTENLQIQSQDLPFRVGERVSSLSEITEIPCPFEGEIVYVEDLDKYYIITALEDKVVSGLVFPNSKVTNWKELTGTGNIFTVQFGESGEEVEIDKDGNVDLGNPGKDLWANSLYYQELSYETLKSKYSDDIVDAESASQTIDKYLNDLGGTELSKVSGIMRQWQNVLAESKEEVHAEMWDGESWITSLRTDGSTGLYGQLQENLYWLTDWARKNSTSTDLGLWDTSLDPSATEIVGDLSIVDSKKTLLVKVGDNTQIIGELQGNNWLKYSDGSYAPTIISSDPSQSYETSVDSGYDIVVGWTEPLWIICGEIGNSGRRIYGLWKEPTEYDGILAHYLEPIGLSAGPCCQDLSTNCFRSLLFDCSISPGDYGASGISVYNQEGKFLQQYNSSQGGRFWQFGMTRAQADSMCTAKGTATPATMYVWMAHLMSEWLKYGTRDLGKYFGYGLSGEVNEENWGKQSGTRYRIKDGEWKYTPGTFEEPYYYFQSATDSEATEIKAISQVFCGSDSFRTLCLEPQMALSWAVENGIEESERFGFQGSIFWYTNIPGQPTLLEGPELNARLYKEYTMSGSYKVLDKYGLEVELSDIQAVIEYPVISGELFLNPGAPMYLGGFEGIVKMSSIPDADSKDIYTNQVSLWMSETQDSWIAPVSYESLSGSSYYEAEGEYRKIGEARFGYLGYSKSSYPYTCYPESTGASGTTGECLYVQAYCPQGSEFNWGTSNAEVGSKRLVFPVFGATLGMPTTNYALDLRYSGSVQAPVCSYFQTKLPDNIQ